jgi:uncharacterized protein YidB (DUF937 family)
VAGLEDILGQVLKQQGGTNAGVQSGAGGGGLGDLLGGLFGGGGGASRGGGGSGMATAAAVLAPIVAGFLKSGGLEKLLSGFRQAGMQKEADSWVSTGRNEPISAEQVEKAVEPGKIDEVASELGVSHDEAAAVLAEVIPGVVDAVTPQGQVPSTEELAAKIGG